MKTKNLDSSRCQQRIVRRWRRQRPHCGGKWWFREDGRHTLVDHTEILLTSQGSHVESVDDAEEGTDQFYFEMTETTQKQMPGLWMQAPANDELCEPPTKNREPRSGTECANGGSQQ